MSNNERKKKNKKKNNDVTGQKTKSSKSSSAVIITALLAAVAGISFYYMYTLYKHIPEVPEIDLDYWWGKTARSEQNTAIRPFRIHFTDAMEEQFRRKSEFYRQRTHPQSFAETAWTYGVHSKALKRVFAHWIFEYKFAERQKYFNQFNHFKTNIQGLDIHFVHVKPNVTDNVTVLPILLMHGWPGSIREFYDVIPILTTPRPEYDFVFEVIAPSLPGFGYSEAASKPGMNPVQAAVIMRNLMRRLGYKQYFIQGGDFGSTIGTHMSTLFTNEVLGFHTNMPMEPSPIGLMQTVLHAAWKAVTAGGPFWENVWFAFEETGYFHLQATKPDTIGIGLNESPAGLLAYILDKWQVFTDTENKFRRDGGISKYYNTTDLLDNIMMYWATGSITTSMRFYKESIKSKLQDEMLLIPTSVPTWAFKLKHEVVHQPDCILKRKYTNLLGSTEYDFGGHFAAFERPVELSDDVFKSVQKFLEFHKNK